MTPKRPWMKFYPSDWRGDKALSLCSLAARGLWMEMICIMHEAEPYGTLIVNGEKIDETSLGRLVNIDKRTVAKLLEELERYGALHKDENGFIYSKRMRRDHERSQIYSANGKAGGSPILLKQKEVLQLKPSRSELVIQGDNTQKLEARVQNENRTLLLPISDLSQETHMADREDATRPAYPEEFEEFWKIYPKREGTNPKAPAFKKFTAATKRGASHEAILAGARRYRAECDRLKYTGTRYVQQAETWLNQQSWNDYQPSDRPSGFNGNPPTKRPPTAQDLEMARRGAELFDEWGNLKRF